MQRSPFVIASSFIVVLSAGCAAHDDDVASSSTLADTTPSVVSASVSRHKDRSSSLSVDVSDHPVLVSIAC